MSKSAIPLIISLILLVGTAGLGFKTKGLVEQKATELKVTTQNLTTTKATLATAQKTLETRTTELATATKAVDDQKAQIATLETDLKTANGKVETMTASVAEKETRIAALGTEIEELKVKMNGPKGPGDEPGPDLVAKVDALTKEVQELTVARDAMQQRQKAAEENLVAAQQRIRHYEQPITQAGLSGTVQAVDNGWNFVVVNLGDRQGVTVNSPLLVYRNRQMIARLKITSVESNSSIADVVSGSMAKGQSVQRGDRVVFAGNRANPTQAPAASPGAETASAQPGAGAPQ
jgi:SMC interacting uncharacterized protein involved in chromosome segregation